MVAELAAPLSDSASRSGRFWPRAALAAAQMLLAADSRVLVARWVAGDLAVAGDPPWSRPGWHAVALAWTVNGAGPVGQVEQVRVSEFSTALRIEAGRRASYFKSVAKAAAREPLFIAALARRLAHLPPVLAVSALRRFLLLAAFAGEPLAAPEDVDVWMAAAQAYGELQRQCLGAGDELRALGCAVATAVSLAASLSAVVDESAALLTGEPAGLGDDQIAALRAFVPERSAAAAALDAGPVAARGRPQRSVAGQRARRAVRLRVCRLGRCAPGPSVP